MGKEQRKAIRGWTLFLVVIVILNLVILIGLGFYMETINNLFTNWIFLASYALIILSIIGLFMYKKWGFYLFTLYLIYLIFDKILIFDFISLILLLVIYGYFIWYKGLYKNFKNLGGKNG